MARVFEDEFMDIQIEMVQTALELAERAKEPVEQLFLLVFNTADGTTHSSDLYFKTENRVDNYQHLVAGFTYDEFCADHDTQYKLSRQLIKLCRENGRPHPEEMRLSYNLKTEELEVDYGYDVPEGIHGEDLSQVWFKELQEKCSVQQQENKEEKKQKKKGFRLPFFWKK